MEPLVHARHQDNLCFNTTKWVSKTFQLLSCKLEIVSFEGVCSCGLSSIFIWFELKQYSLKISVMKSHFSLLYETNDIKLNVNLLIKASVLEFLCICAKSRLVFSD